MKDSVRQLEWACEHGREVAISVDGIDSCVPEVGRVARIVGEYSSQCARLNRHQVVVRIVEHDGQALGEISQFPEPLERHIDGVDNGQCARDGGANRCDALKPREFGRKRLDYVHPPPNSHPLIAHKSAHVGIDDGQGHIIW